MQIKASLHILMMNAFLASVYAKMSVEVSDCWQCAWVAAV